MGGPRVPRQPVPFDFRWLSEERPGSVWKSEFERTWESYESWFLANGDEERPSLAACRAELERHMPELVPLWEHLVELAGGDERVARMLSLYRPTPYLTGCSQAVWSRGTPVLVRNYDYSPAAFEGTFLQTAWTGTRTLATSDCLWGVLDGINEHGLAVSLAFGGRRETGDGFGIPLILRYVLETCRTTSPALDVLRRIPTHMPYNVTVLDESGDRAVAEVAPDQSASILRTDVATNRQGKHRWPRYDRLTLNRERERHLHALLERPELDSESFARRFLRPPLYNTRYSRAFGTLYTCVCRPRERSVTYLWPGLRRDQSLAAFEPGEERIVLGRLTDDAG